MDFDESRLYYSHQQLQPRNGEEGQDDFNVEDEAAVDLKAVRRHFREFLREFFFWLLNDCKNEFGIMDRV